MVQTPSLRTYKGGAPDLYRQDMQQRFKDPTLAKDEAVKSAPPSTPQTGEQAPERSHCAKEGGEGTVRGGGEGDQEHSGGYQTVEGTPTQQHLLAGVRGHL